MTGKHLRDVPLAGMNAVVAGAAARGYAPGDPAWVNLGQGQPEIGDIPGAPARITRVDLEPGDHAYGPVNGTRELRSAVAELYNRTYRAGRASRYTGDNVAIVSGGRPALNRTVAALGSVDVGYMLPDYAAYEDILDRNAPRIRPVGVATRVTDGEPAALLDAVTTAGLRALLISNPRNPTGEVIAGGALAALVKGATAAGCALLVDEFYSHYVHGRPAGPVSAASYVDDVDEDPVIIFDGLTKNFRYPGWRLGWVVGPAETVSVVERVGQAMDGGPSQVVQRAAMTALEPDRARAETSAVRSHFAAKRAATIEGLRAAGIRVDPEPAGTFYVWGCLADLPEPLRDAEAFFHAALDHRVITVPGPAFDLDPGHTRSDTGAFNAYVRFSYGPPMDSVATGLRRLAAMVDSYR